MLDALGTRVTISWSGTVDVSFPAQRDQLHARLVGYVAQRLVDGFVVRREVPIGGYRVHGWIDLLAWDPRRRVVLVVEAKSSIRDLGALERQVGWYEGAALPVARAAGWPGPPGWRARLGAGQRRERRLHPVERSCAAREVPRAARLAPVLPR